MKKEIMPLRGRKFISEFLIPSLNTKRFGSRLRWLSAKNFVFELQWNHKSAASWTEMDATVFIEWDKRKGHYNPNDKMYYIKSKQRFRAVLNKLIKDKYIVEVCSTDKNSKVYCMGNMQKNRENLESPNFAEYEFNEDLMVENQKCPSNSLGDHDYASAKEKGFFQDMPLSVMSGENVITRPCTMFSKLGNIINPDDHNFNPTDFSSLFLPQMSPFSSSGFHTLTSDFNSNAIDIVPRSEWYENPYDFQDDNLNLETLDTLNMDIILSNG